MASMKESKTQSSIKTEKRAVLNKDKITGTDRGWPELPIKIKKPRNGLHIFNSKIPKRTFIQKKQKRKTQKVTQERLPYNENTGGSRNNFSLNKRIHH